jgi:hypothetical protein
MLNQIRLQSACFVGLICAMAISASAGAQAPAAQRSRASDAALTKRIDQLNADAMDAYDKLQLEAARQGLFQALDLAMNEALGAPGPIVRTYLNLGVVLGAGFNEQTTAVEYFAAALRLNADAKVDPARANRFIQGLFERARRQVGDQRAPSNRGRISTTRRRTTRSGRLAATQPSLAPRHRTHGGNASAAEAPTMALSILTGFGIGLVAGGQSAGRHPQVGGEAAKVGISTGAALAPFHVAAEFAYRVSDRWQLAAFGRLQLVNALSGETAKGRVSALGLARAKLALSDGSVRPHLSFGAGGGVIRHRVALSDYDGDRSTPDDIVDARRAGHAAVSVGADLCVDLSRTVAWVIDLTLMALFPKSATHADINTGLQLRF